MAEEKTKPEQTFHEALEKDIQRLAHEIKIIKIKAEHNHLSEQEIIKKSLSALTPIPSSAQSMDQSTSSSSPLPSYAQSFPPETQLQIEALLDMAFRQGIFKALTEAQKLNNPAIIDTFHDALAGKLYPELKKRGIL